MSNPIDLAKRQVQLRILQIQNNIIKKSQKHSSSLKQYQSIRNVMNRSLQGQPTIQRKLRFLNKLLEQKRLEKIAQQAMKKHSKHIQTQCIHRNSNQSFQNIEQNTILSKQEYERMMLQKQLLQQKRKLQKDKLFNNNQSPQILKCNIYSSNCESLNNSNKNNIQQNKLIRIKSQQYIPFKNLDHYQIRNMKLQDSIYQDTLYGIRNLSCNKENQKEVKQLYSFRSKADESLSNGGKNRMSEKQDQTVNNYRTTKPFSSKQNISQCSNLLKSIERSSLQCEQNQKLINDKNFRFQGIGQNRSSTWSKIEQQKQILQQKIEKSYNNCIQQQPENRSLNKDESFKKILFSPLKHSTVAKQYQLSQKKISQLYKKISNRIQFASCMTPKASFTRGGDMSKIILNRYGHQKNQRNQVINCIVDKRWV